MADLIIENVEVSYKKFQAVKNISLQISNGTIIGFIGADGAGKSSLMHAIAGVVQCKGNIRYKDTTYNSPKQADKIRSSIGLMPQGIGLVLYETLTVAEHLDFFTDLHNLQRDAKYTAYREKLLHMSGLTGFQERKAGELSGGMMQKLSLVCTLLHRPKLLVLDEPTTGVDPLSRLELWEILQNIKTEENAIILVSTAYMQEAAKMDRIVLFDEGKIIAQGTADELLQGVEDFTYKAFDEKTNDSITFDGYSYSLKRLDFPHAKPKLEALFFINSLKKEETLPQVEIDAQEGKENLPEIIMQAKGLTKCFGTFVANDAIDMELKKNEVVGLFGANGAGKTTFIKMLLGLHHIDGGELILLGKSIKNGRDRQTLKSKIGYMSQHFALYKDMTVRENLLYFANMHRIPPTTALQRIKRYAYQLGFEKYLNDMPNSLPLGVNQRFSIAAALLHEPVVLFLDEPTSGVDTIARAQFWEIVHLLKQKWNISILVTTHYMSEAEYCDRVVLLKEGKKIADDTVEALYVQHPQARSFEDIFSAYYREVV